MTFIQILQKCLIFEVWRVDNNSILFEVNLKSRGYLFMENDEMYFYLPYDYNGSSDLVAVGKKLCLFCKLFGVPLLPPKPSPGKD